MGPSRTGDQKPSQDDVVVKALLREKDSRIATLEARLEAYSARASTAHTRLLKTIDVLDALRSQHALEIAAEEQAKTKLVQEVDGWRSVAKTLEVERDELKDVVEDLIEKVQVSNEWSSWPCSRMHITKLAGSLNPGSPDQAALGATHRGRAQDSNHDDLLAYATSIIARLRMELDVERQRHCNAVEEANLHIDELEAKVAVREAELESRLTPGESQHDPIHAAKKRGLEKRLPEPEPLSDEECLRFLQSNNARNRSLEIEVRRIAERLEYARTAASASGDSCRAYSSPKPSPSRARSASVDSNALSRPLEVAGVTSAPEAVSPSSMLSIAQLDNQIRMMTTQMDALVSERTTLIESAARQRRVTDGINMDTFQDVLRVERECVRLQAEVDDLREQLEHAHSSARAREKALSHEIEQLRASDLRPSHLLEDDLATEASMELASPLVPTTILGPSAVATAHTLDSEGDLVSLPFSPRHVSSPPPDTPPTPSHSACHSPGLQDIGRVQAALDVARTLLAQKEEALVQLRAEMERLQQEAQAQSLGDRDSDGG